MRSFDEWCKWFANIEANPKAPVQMTIREHILAGLHLDQCPTCEERRQRVIASAPPEKFTDHISPN